MMKILLSSLAALLVAFGAYVLFFRAPTITNYPPRPGPIVAFGDSLVAGVGATEGSDFVSLVSKSINEPIENFGRPGDTTAAALERLGEVLERHPSVAIVLVGGNDYLKRIPRDETFKNLRTIVDALQGEGTLVVLLGVRGGVLTDNFKDEFSALTKETRSAYVPDVLKNLVGNRQYMYDQVHPNDDGYAIIAERVLKVLRPLLQ